MLGTTRSHVCCGFWKHNPKCQPVYLLAPATQSVECHTAKSTVSKSPVRIAVGCDIGQMMAVGGTGCVRFDGYEIR